jgi:hypothetical protein
MLPAFSPSLVLALYPNVLTRFSKNVILLRIPDNNSRARSVWGPCLFCLNKLMHVNLASGVIYGVIFPHILQGVLSNGSYPHRHGFAQKQDGKKLQAP